MSENKTYTRPTVVATVTLALGAAASIAINVKAVSLSAAPEAGAYVSGISWPIALFLAIELLIHTPWLSSNRDRCTKGAVLIIVAGVAAWVSYWHGAHVLSHWGYDTVSRYAGPLVADAAMGLATLALNRIGQAKRAAKDVATVATTPVASPSVASASNAIVAAVGQAVDTLSDNGRYTLATDEPTLAEDWGNLEEELATWTAEAKSEPAATQTRTETSERPAVKLTTVPAAAAERIQDAVAAGVPGAEVDEKITVEGLAGSARTARRYRAALANGTARVVS